MISRFYCPIPLQSGRTVTLPPEAAHHALRVLRLRSGDELVLFDGLGGEYPGRVVEAARNLRVTLEGRRDIEREAPLALTLAQALPAGDKMDWVVQKAVELGAAKIQPVQAKRSVVRLAGERADKRVAHWQQVAISACEQSGRNRLPEIGAIVDLPHYLAMSRGENESLVLLSAQQGMRLSALPKPPAGVTLLIGPEGGFDEGEESAAHSVGFQPVSLGPRVLRSETAGLAAMAAILALWGDV
ncbi:MAG: 16S rRNA (uracil(1498)-N(3))-methyltransferase [Rhodocyclaceae bacterium]|nr:MAG: 16S rRNA (uracil(1498)-N(3))-methyltransferase [Rhodocyclaceae bacterium]